MRDSQRLIQAIGEIDDEKIAKAGRALGYTPAPARTARSRIRAGKIFIIAAVVALIFSLGLTAYAVYSQWAKGLEERFHPTEEERTYAEDNGLLANPEAESGADGIVSATAGGVTITVQQTIADKYSALISLRIEGYSLPEGSFPSIGGFTLTVGGERPPAISGSFVGEQDENGNLIFCGEDGALEYDFSVRSGDYETNFFDGKEIRLSITGLGTGDKLQHTPDIEETWELVWTMKAASEQKFTELNTEIGNTGTILKEAELSPLHLRVVYETDGIWEGYKTLDLYDVQPIGVRLKDGTVYQKIFWGGGAENYIDYDACLLESVCNSDQILNPDDVEALLFACDYPWGRELTEDEIYIVPLA